MIDDITTRLQTASRACHPVPRPTVTDLANLRAWLRPASTDYKVYKNTLARRAAADAGFTEMAELLEGPVAIAFVRPEGDAVIAAKALRSLPRTTPTSSSRAGCSGRGC